MKSNKDLLGLENNNEKSNDIASKLLINNNNNNGTNSQPRSKPNFSKIEESSVLKNVRDFLPKLKEANKVLKKKIENNEDVNIENVKDGQEYIQMNLALGILEHKEELNENNIKINTSSSSSTNSNTSNNKNKKNKSIVELDNNNRNNKNNEKPLEQKEKENNSLNCTENDNKNKNILEILNQQPTSVLDRFILETSDDDDGNNEENEVLEPIEVNY